MSHINNNFLENKFEPLKTLLKDKVDIIVVTETKLDESFPLNQFLIEGYSTPFRRDRDSKSKGGGVLIYIRDDIPCKQLKSHNVANDIEGIFIELVLRKNKWIPFGGYNPKK